MIPMSHVRYGILVSITAAGGWKIFEIHGFGHVCTRKKCGIFLCSHRALRAVNVRVKCATNCDLDESRELGMVGIRLATASTARFVRVRLKSVGATKTRFNGLKAQWEDFRSVECVQVSVSEELLKSRIPSHRT